MLLKTRVYSLFIYLQKTTIFRLEQFPWDFKSLFELCSVNSNSMQSAIKLFAVFHSHKTFCKEQI